jgi:hypothetical protein
MTYTGTDYELDYLFIAELKNGQIIKQDPTDKPKNSSWGSAFTDVVKENLYSLKRFSLVGKGHLFTIDLEDGHLEVDGNKLYPPHQVMPGSKLKLIYWRQITRDFKVGEDGKPLPPKVKYLIGWEYKHKGKNIKWEMGIK